MAEEELAEQQELFEHHRFKADPGQSLLRIDKYLADRMENVSRTRIQNAANAGNILVNRNPVKPNYRVKPDDIVQIVFPNPPREIELIPENIPINIVYEDEDVLVVNKEPGWWCILHMGIIPGHLSMPSCGISKIFLFLNGRIETWSGAQD